MRDLSILILFVALLAASLLTSATGSNQTDLLSRHTGTSRSSRVTDVLMVTTTMRVLHRVHGHTTNLGPAVALHTVLVVRATSLEHRLVHAAPPATMPTVPRQLLST